MRKKIKWVGLITGMGVAFGLLLVGALLFSTSMQRSIVLRVLAAQAEDVELEGVQLSPSLSALEIKRLSLVKEGVGIELESAQLQGAFVKALFGNDIQLDLVQVKGLKVDLSKRPDISAQTGAIQESPEADLRGKAISGAFNGLLTHADLPLRLTLDEVDMDALILLPDTRLIQAEIQGQGIAPGARSTLNIVGTFTDENENAEVKSIDMQGVITIDQANGSAVSEINVDVMLVATSPRFSIPARMHAVANVLTAGDSEIYYLKLENITSEVNPITVVLFKGTFDTIERGLAGDYEVNARTEDIKPFIANLPLFQFDLSGKGEVELNFAAGHGNLSAQAQLDANSLGLVDERLAPIKSLDTSIELDIGFTQDTYAFKQFKARAVQGENVALAVELLAPLELNVQSLKKTTQVPQGDVVAVHAKGVPLAWIDPWVPEYSLSQGLLSMDSNIVHNQGTWQFNATDSLLLGSVSVYRDGQPVVERLGLSVRPSLQLKESELAVELKAINVTQGSATLLEGSLAAQLYDLPELSLGSVKFDLKSNIAALTNQPFADDYGFDYNLRFGKLALEGSYHLNGKNRGATAVKGELTNLMAGDSELSQLNRIAFSAHGTALWPEGIELRMPIEMLSNEGLTDCVLDVSWSQNDDGSVFDVTIGGESLVVDDFLALKKIFEKETVKQLDSVDGVEGSHLQKVDRVSPDTQPVWAGHQGTVSLNLNTLSAFNHVFQSLTTTLMVEPDSLALKPFKGSYFGADVDGTADLVFSPESTIEPYALVSKLSLEKLNTFELIRHGLRNKKTRLNGLFDVQMDAHGRGPNLETLFKHLQGNFNLQGDRGSIVLLADRKLLRGFSKITRFFVGNGGSLLGRLGVDINETDAIVELVKLLESIEYDEVIVKGYRGSDLDVNIEQMLLIGPRIRLEGNGKIIHQGVNRFSDNPLRIQALLSARGKTAQLFDKVGWISGEKGEDGFYPGLPFEISGSVGDPDYQEIMNRVQQAVDKVSTFGLKGSRKSSKPNKPEESEESKNTQQKQSRKPEVEDVVRGVFDLIGR